MSNPIPTIFCSLILAALGACGREPKTVGALKPALGSGQPQLGAKPALDPTSPGALLAPLWRIPAQDEFDRRAAKFIQAENAELVLQKLKEELGASK